MGCLNDIQIDLKSLKRSGKFEYILITDAILVLADSVKTMNRPDQTRPGPTVIHFDGLFIENNKS